MSHINSLLNDEAKASVIRARIVKLAQEGYQVDLNLKFSQQKGKEEDTKKFQDAVDAIEESLSFHIAELNALNLPLNAEQPAEG